MSAVFAAVFHPKWSEYKHLDHARRMLRMRSAISEAYTAMSGAAARMGVSKPLYIFAAPEYWFTKSVSPAYTLHSEDEKKEIYNELTILSRNRYLLAPGTIAWCRPCNGLLGGRTHEGWNTAPIFYEGKLVHEYDKIFDDGGFHEFTKNVVFRPGMKSQCFTVEKLKFGIEVCGDFNEGNLSKEAAPQSLDFELMLSGTNFHDFNEAHIEKVPVKNGGYFIHADTLKMEYNGAWCVQRGSGTHGRALPIIIGSGSFYDPWTGKALGDDRLGRALGVRTVLFLRLITNSPVTAPLPSLNKRYSQEFSATPRPPQQPQNQAQQFQLYLQVTPVAPFLDTTSGNYTVRATAKVTSVPSHAGIANEFIRFQAVNGRVTAPPSGLWATNGQGQAVTDITGNEKNQPLQIIASCHTATVKYEARLETLSAGHVSKIGRLQGLNIPEISAYHLPI